MAKKKSKKAPKKSGKGAKKEKKKSNIDLVYYLTIVLLVLVGLYFLGLFLKNMGLF